jgi:rare lipoprotein A
VIRPHVLICALLAAACTPRAHAPPPPHYVLGPPYQADGLWYYPEESFDLDITGLAAVGGSGHPPLTTDGEAFSQAALAAANATLQLPAIARITNLENGRGVEVRINDRGPVAPGRLVLVTRRIAALLGFPADGVARVRLQVLAQPSQAALASLAGAPHLAIAAAPRAAVEETPLAPPGQIQQASPPQPIAPAEAAEVPAAPPLVLPETVTQATPEPGQLWIILGSFHSYRYAAVQRARLSFLHPTIAPAGNQDGEEFRVRLGPFATVSAADAALAQALGAGMTGARIVVE